MVAGASNDIAGAHAGASNDIAGAHAGASNDLGGAVAGASSDIAGAHTGASNDIAGAVADATRKAAKNPQSLWSNHLTRRIIQFSAHKWDASGAHLSFCT